MNDLAATFLPVLFDLTVRGSLAVGALFAIDLLLGRWLAARHRRRLWLLAPAAFLLPLWCCLPLLPATAVPTMKAAPEPSWRQELFPSTERPAAARDTLRATALFGWGIGVLAGAGVVAIRTVRAARRWGKCRFSTDASLLELVEDCRNIAGVRSPVGVILSGQVQSPALVGWLRPKLLLPGDWVKTCPPGQIRDVLLHEFAHLRGADLAWGWLFAAIRVLHWFNPFAHFATRRWLAVREDAADEFVLRMRPAGAGSYDETLLAFLFTARRAQPFHALGISENLLNLKRRIHMIQTHPRRILPPAIAAIMLVMLTALTFVRVTRAEPSEADRKTAAVAAMKVWLEGIDRGGYAQSWTDASKKFRDAVTQEQWVAALDAARKPAGACSKRELASVLLQNGVPQPGGGTLAGEFAIAQFKSSFVGLFAAVETVTFEREADGTWRASGYFIKPG